MNILLHNLDWLHDATSLHCALKIYRRHVNAYDFRFDIYFSVSNNIELFLIQIWLEVYSVYGFSGCPERDWMSLTLAERAAMSSGIQPPPLVSLC